MSFGLKIEQQRLSGQAVLITGAGCGLVQSVEMIQNENGSVQTVAADIMKKHPGGSIINVSSPSGYKGFEKESINCASKHGLEGFSKTTAMEYAQYNIAVNIVAPGGFSSQVRIKPTSITHLEFDNYSDEEKKKWNDPVSFTEDFVFLGLQMARGITGERIAAFELSERIRTEGWNLSAKKLVFSGKGCSKY